MSTIPSVAWWRPEPEIVARVDASQPVVQSGRLGFRALLVFTVILVAAPQEFFAPLKPLRLALVTAVMATACYLSDRMRRQTVAPIAREVWLTLGLVGWTIAMVPFSYWPGGSVSMLLELYLKSVAMFILLAGVIDTPERLTRICWTLGACIVPVGLTALLHFERGDFLASADGRIAGYGTSGLAGNPNDLALLLNLVIPLMAALAANARKPLSRAIALGIVGLSVCAVIVTFSRSGFLTLATIAVLYLWRLARRGRVGVVSAIVGSAVLLVALAPAGYGARLMTVSNIDTDPTMSAQNRWQDMKVATAFAVAHPVIGAGPGMDFLALNALRGNRWVSVHNAYLNYAVDLGLPGLLLFLTLLVSCIRAAYQAEQLHRSGRYEDDLARTAAAIRISLLAFVVAAFFYPIAYQAYFYYFAGLAVALRAIARATPLAVTEGRR